MVTSLRSWFPSTSLYVDFRPPPLTKSGFSGVARMKRSAIRERFRSWPLEECADLGTSPFMVRLAHHERGLGAHHERNFLLRAA